MQIHGLLEFPVNDSTFVGGTTMQIHGLLKPMQMIPHSLLKPVTGIIAPALANERGAAYNSAEDDHSMTCLLRRSYLSPWRIK